MIRIYPRNVLLALTCGLSCTGVLSAAEPVYPLTAASAANGTVFVSDLRLPGVWKIEDAKGAVFFQASPKFRTPLAAVRCVRLDRKGRVLACDSSTREVYRFGDDAQPQGLTGGKIGIPVDVVEDADGNLLVSDLETQRILRIPAAGGPPEEAANVRAPRGLWLDGEGRLWIVSHGKDHVLRLLPDGKLDVAVTGRPFQFPHEIVVQADGTALISDGYAKTIWKIAPGGKPEQWIHGEPLQNPVGLCLRGESLLIVDPRAKAVFQADAAGKLDVFWKGRR